MKTIQAPSHLHLGHVHIQYEDGTMDVLPRGLWEHLDLKPGAKLEKKYDAQTNSFTWENVASRHGSESYEEMQRRVEGEHRDPNGVAASDVPQTLEVENAVDQAASEIPAQQEQPAETAAAEQDESGTA